MKSKHNNPRKCRTISACVAILAVTSLLLVAGCGSKPSVIGTWVGMNKISTVDQTVTLVVNNDGTYSAETKLTGTHQTGDVTVTEKGNYKMDGDSTLITVAKDFSFDNVPSDRLEQTKQLKESQKGMDSPKKIAWIDSDTFSLSLDSGSALTMKRQK